ncbi:MAG: DUF899 domain-containing protein [Phycisphaerales bacterium]|nr:DUF899 domain-containing protein [Phycisphaerales bacterium]
MPSEFNIRGGQLAEIESRLSAVRAELHAAQRAVFAKPVHDYSFVTAQGTPIRLSELFGTKKDLLIVHNMGERCQHCALWADGFIGFSRHLKERAGFVLASPDNPQALRQQIASRGWNFPVISDAESTFALDMGFEMDAGSRVPGVSSFHLEDDGSIQRVSGASFGPGDEFCSVWPLMGLLQGGHKDWSPHRPS